MSDTFGDLGGLATALGITQPDWFRDPGAHLATMLSDPAQKAALIEVVDGLLGGGDATTEGGRTLVPIAAIAPVSVFATLADRDGLTDIGLLVRVRVDATSTDVGGRLDLSVPLVAAAGAQPSAEPLLLGTPHGTVRLEAGLDLPTDAAAGPGGLRLGAAELSLAIPTDGSLPDVGLALRGLVMPGASHPADVVVDPEGIADLGDALLQLVLGLVGAQLDGLPSDDPVRALGGLFGLVRADGVPDFPIAELIDTGAGALARWWALALADDARDAWFGHLRTLLGGTTVTTGGAPAVEFTIAGAVRLRVGVRTAAGPGGLPVVTPTIAVVTDAATGVELSLEVEPVSFDLASAVAVALPSLRVAATIGGDGEPLLVPQGAAGLRIGVGAVKVGFALTADRTPRFVLAAVNAVVGTTAYPWLDLSTADALAEVGEAAAGDAVETAAGVLLDALGDVGDVLRALTGLGAAVAPIDPVGMLSDPIGAIRDRWRALLSQAPAVVRAVLEDVRDAFASVAGRAVAVTGDGTPALPYRVVLVPGLDLELVNAGSRIALALSAGIGRDLPAATGARFAVETRVSLLRADLDPDHASAAVLGDLAGAVSIVPAGAGPLTLGGGAVTMRTGGLGARVRWRPGADPAVRPWLRDPALDIAGRDVDLSALTESGVLAGGPAPLADMAAEALQDTVMDAAHALAESAVDTATVWADAAGAAAAEAVEQLLAGVLSAGGSNALDGLRDLAGWGPAGGERLALDALVADPPAELRRWVTGAFGIDPADGSVADPDRLIAAAARLARLAGIPVPDTTGTIADPLRFALPGLELLAGAAGDDVARVASRVTGALDGWAPGDALPDAATLLTGLAADAGIDDVLADVLRGRSLTAEAIEGLVARFTDTDGVIGVASEALPAGIDLIRVDGLVHGAALDGTAVRAAVTAAVGTLPERVVLVAVEADGEPVLLPARGDPSIALDIDLTAVGAPAASFALPGPAPAGLTIIRLAGKAASAGGTGADAGFDGQVARLARTLASLGDVLVIAGGAAGRVAVAAAEDTAVARVVTVGAPWTPVALGDVDAGPAAEGLRLLASLADLGDDGAPVDDAVRLGRDLVSALLGRDTRGDPLTELSAPERAVPAGIDVTALVGRVGAEAVREAITAVVRRALDVRGLARAAGAAAADAAGRWGVRIPLAWGDAPGGLRAAIETDLDLAALAAAATGSGAVPRRMSARLRLAADGRWLIGGPDPGRSPGLRPLALRALTLDVEVPLASTSADSGGEGRLVLHDALVFGVRRARWVVDLGDTGALLPELRALLGELAAVLRREAGEALDAAGDAAAAPGDSAARAVLSVLRALGVIGPDDGFDVVTLTTLLSDPAVVLRTALANPAALAAALREAAGDDRTDAGATVRLTAGEGSSSGVITVDLAGRTVEASVGVVSSDAAVPGIAVTVAATPLGARATLDLAWSAGVGVRASLDVDDDGAIAVSAGIAVDAYGNEIIPVWPPEAALASGRRIGDAALAFARDAALDLALRALREALAATDGARDSVDAVLTAVGLLQDARVVWPGALVADPGAWLRDRAGGAAAALPRLLDAAATALGIAAAPGRLRILDGLEVVAATVDGALRVGIALDPTRFAGADPGFVLTVDAAAVVRADGTLRPEAAVAVGTSAGALVVTLGAQSGGADDAVGVTVALRPATGDSIRLHPGGQGLGSAVDVAQSAVVAALPHLLTVIASHDPDGAPGTPLEVAARVVATAGRALGVAVRADDVTTFDPAAFTAFVTHPTAALESALASGASEALMLLRDAARALFDAGDVFDVDVAGDVLSIELGPAGARVRLAWDRGADTLAVDVVTDAIPVLGALRGGATVSAQGVQRVDVVVGPVGIPIGPLVLSPLARFSWRPTQTDIGLGLAASDESRVLARFVRSGTGLAVGLVAEIGGIDPATLLAAADGVLEDPAEVAAALARVVLGLAADVVLSLEPVADFLDETTLPMPAPAGTSLRSILDGVVLDGDRLDLGIIDDLDEPDALLTRLGRLARALVPALPSIPLGAGFGVGILAEPVGSRTRLGLRLDVAEETPLNDGDVIVALVADAAWIGPDPAGVRVSMVTVGDDDVDITPGIEVRGLGIRLSRATGPLLDAGLTIGSVRLLTYGSVREEAGAVALGGGVSLALEGLGLALGGGSGGSNAIAQGVMPSGGEGDDAPKPAFSPSLSILKRPGEDLAVDVRAGAAAGPWWLTVQREFGPIYLEQVGLDVTTVDGSITRISVLVDGAVSLFGFSAAVDDLSLTYSSTGSPYAGGSWAVDVAGFAISAETGGLTLAGGLRKFTPAEGGTEYLGMLLARFGTYGLTVYGGFGQVGPPDDQYLSLFLLGGVNGPIGGVPAFFVTGIAGGFGVNRRLIVPSDLAQLPTFALVRALDSAAADVDPFQEIARLRDDFPPERGSFWFAAGLSFNSFVLVDGIVAVAIEFGNGFELSILGLARMTLPRPQLTLVSIELALIARISSREGVILVQAQLTDNSWLILPSVRLTGGFAFAAWFGGPNKGQFVLTMGGYHPDFHREGYPVVPRLGIELRIGDWVVISGTSYFALTSEALMAGLKIEIHAELGPAWAHVVLGADAIIYFDPFWMQITVYASIDAGITIDVWIGKITISVHLGARITLEGPPFHVIATLEIGPVEVTLEIGPSHAAPAPLDWTTFLEKYLEDAGGARARALSAITGKGTIPPAGKAASGGDASPDGQPDRPFRVVAEFEATLTSTVPIARYDGARLASTGTGAAETTVTLPGLVPMAVAPMHKGDVRPRLRLRVRARTRTGSIDTGDGTDYLGRDGVELRHAVGDFPIGVWGPVPDTKTVPEGELLRAPHAITIAVEAIIPTTPTPPAIRYRQVRTGRRRVLPLVPSIAAAQRSAVRDAGNATAAAVAALRAASAGDDDTTIAARLLAGRGHLGPAGAADWRARLAAPVRLGSLGQDLGDLLPEPSIDRLVAPPTVADAVRPARVTAVLTAPVLAATRADAAALAGTSVSPVLLERLGGARRVRSVTAPTVAGVAASLDEAIATRLVRAGSAAGVAGSTVLAASAASPAAVSAPAASTASRVMRPESVAAIRDAGEALIHDGLTLRDGDVALLDLPDGARDGRDERPALRVETGRARVIVFGGGGAVLSDGHHTRRDRIPMPVGARGVALIAGDDEAAGDGFSVHGGWHDASVLPSASAGALVAPGCVVNAVGVFARTRADAAVAWTTPSAITSDRAPTTTTFRAPPAGDRVIAAIAVGVTGAGADGVAVGLEWAEPVGAPLVTVDDDGTAVLVFAIRSTGEGPVRVNAAIDEDRDVTGIFAVAAPSPSDPADAARWLANAIGARGLRGLDRPLSSAGTGTTRIRWSKR